MGTSWRGADSSRLVRSPNPTVDPWFSSCISIPTLERATPSILPHNWNGIDVDDKSACISGKQRLVTFDGISIPINIRRGLPYIDMCPHTDQEWEELPHVLLTEDANWDPTHLDHKQGDDPAWYEQQDDPPLLNSDFNLCGDYHHRIVYKSDLTSDMYTPTV